MQKLTIKDLEKAGVPPKETAMDKTTRAAREILEDESEIRRRKTERLRRARLQYQVQEGKG
ncbi:hypothetical protein [Phycobacter sp. K97]|uniref:hypothetical protein n=1 Tax=Phycobacter sedimenti TaxID=3133977 RepID=UPI00311EA598